MNPHLNKTTRLWLYGVAVAVVPIMVAYDAISTEHAPLWLAFIAAFLGLAAPATAMIYVSDDDPHAAHWDDDLEATEAEFDYENG